MLLYAVTDRAWSREQMPVPGEGAHREEAFREEGNRILTAKKTLYEQVECALKGGVTCVQLREKHLGDTEFLNEAVSIGGLCKSYGVPFIINDNVEIARACGADGIHVGQEDMKMKEVRRLVGDDMIVGVSVHTVEEAIEAEGNGADYLGVGAVFSTSTKTDVSVLTHAMLKEICNAVSVPVVAIGGINKDNIASLSESGVDGVALVSAIFSAADIESECRKLYSLAAAAFHS